MALYLTLHLIGITLWVGGMLLLTRMLRWMLSTNAFDERARLFIKRLYLCYLLPGAGLTLAAGILQLVTVGIPFYMQQGWFHAKLTFVIVLLVSTALLGRDLSIPGRLSAGRALVYHGITGATLLAAVALTLFGRS